MTNVRGCDAGQISHHHATRAMMHLLRPCIQGDVGLQADRWASNLAAASSLQQAELDAEAPEDEQPWLVLEQLTRQLWQLHCRKQLGIAVTALRIQVRPIMRSFASSSQA